MNTASKLCINTLTILGSVVLATTCYATEYKMKEVLGPAAAIVTQATRIQIAKLKLISVQVAQNNTLKSTKRIAGYPIQGKLEELNSQDAAEVIKIILENKYYSDVRLRCLNRYFVGLRFTKENKVVEFALGMPCQQALWAFNVSDAPQRWGATFGTLPAQRLVEILETHRPFGK